MDQGFGELRVMQIPDLDARRRWKLTEPLPYVTQAGEEVTAPIDLLTDFASIPAPLRWLVSRTGRHTKAAVIHDYQWSLADDGKLDLAVLEEMVNHSLASIRSTYETFPE